jgi:hypothetical protein
VNFSREVVKKLSQINISSYLINGCYYEDGICHPHCWVGLIFDDKEHYIEAVGGYFVDNSTEYHYKEFFRGFCNG